MFAIFTLGLLFELIFDFKAFSVWSFLIVQFSSILFLLLSILKVPHRYVLTLNILSILATNQLTLLANPQSYHVMIYWIGLTPLFIAILSSVKETLIWTAIILFFIAINGLFINNRVGPYELTLYPDRFLIGGIIFLLTASLLAILFSMTQKKIREKLYQQNLQLTELSDEIKKRIKQLKEYNEHLEERVYERTEELENQNKQLTEYAFINSHLLRGPLARILGIVDLLERSKITAEQEKYIQHLLAASAELDEVITKINKALRQEGKFSRESIQQLKDKK